MLNGFCHQFLPNCRARNGETSVRKDDSVKSAQRILYVNHSPATLVSDERLLRRSGYDVDIVFGADGIMACQSLGEYSSIAIAEGYSIEQKQQMVSWLTAKLAKPVILSTSSLCAADSPSISPLVVERKQM